MADRRTLRPKGERALRLETQGMDEGVTRGQWMKHDETMIEEEGSTMQHEGARGVGFNTKG